MKLSDWATIVPIVSGTLVSIACVAKGVYWLYQAGKHTLADFIRREAREEADDDLSRYPRVSDHDSA